MVTVTKGPHLANTPGWEKRVEVDLTCAGQCHSCAAVSLLYSLTLHQYGAAGDVLYCMCT